MRKLKQNTLEQELNNLKNRYSRDVGCFMAIAGIFALNTSTIAGTIFIVLGLLEMFLGGNKQQANQS